jgi:2-phosphosulfolactate phosphatase
MRVEVFFTPGELQGADVAGRTVVVIDVLRATTTIAEAFAAGARAVYPVASVEEAARLASTLGRDEVLLCGERRCLPIEGFDLGNSPREFTSERVAGKALVMSTTNGTYAISLATGAERVITASFANLGAVAAAIAGDTDVVIVCAGRQGRFALEDAVCAGLLLEALAGPGGSAPEGGDAVDAARSLAGSFAPTREMLANTAAGRDLIDAGLGDDLELCARIDRLDLVPVIRDRHIELLETAAA